MLLQTFSNIKIEISLSPLFTNLQTSTQYLDLLLPSPLDDDSNSQSNILQMTLTDKLRPNWTSVLQLSLAQLQQNQSDSLWRSSCLPTDLVTSSGALSSIQLSLSLLFLDPEGGFESLNCESLFQDVALVEYPLPIRTYTALIPSFTRP